MSRFKAATKKIFIIFSIVTLVGGMPMGVSAQAADSNDSSSEKTEEKKPVYKYNEETGTWDSDEYSWNPKTYETKPVTKPAPKAAADAKKSNNLSDTGPGSTNQATNNGSTNSEVNNNNGLNVNNQIGSGARTGNSTVSGNTTAGSAKTGDAQSIANIMNMLQSSANFGGEGMVTFQQDINGDVVGDILLNPELIFNTGPGSTNTSTNNQTDTVKFNNTTNAAINNDVDLSADSGDALVDSNTNAGDATSGDAYVMANVVNVLNSVIQANQSFMGLINIYGNLDGDILFPPETINKLLTSNVPTSSISINNTTGDITINDTNNQSIENNINLEANSGTANVSGNNTAGNATTGSAKTNLTVLNLTGREVIGANSILVFVNVLGTWMGMIMDAPNGATAAALGGGISQNNHTVDVDVNNTNNASIKNDLNLSANTGNAGVTNNTTAGNATTGNAYAAANVANVNNSSLNLSNWFGLLFINVFGSWNGSFGVDTMAGNRPAASSGNATAGGGASQVFSFIPSEPSNNKPINQFVLKTASSTGEGAANAVVVPANENTGGSGSATTSGSSIQDLAAATRANDDQNKTLLFTGFGVLVGTTLLGADRASNFAQSRRNKRAAMAGTNSAAAVKEI